MGELDISTGVVSIIKAGTPFRGALHCALDKRKIQRHHCLANLSVAHRKEQRQVE
jgi:hypothetical protein